MSSSGRVRSGGYIDVSVEGELIALRIHLTMAAFSLSVLELRFLALAPASLSGPDE